MVVVVAVVGMGIDLRLVEMVDVVVVAAAVVDLIVLMGVIVIISWKSACGLVMHRDCNVGLMARLVVVDVNVVVVVVVVVVV